MLASNLLCYIGCRHDNRFQEGLLQLALNQPIDPPSIINKTVLLEFNLTKAIADIKAKAKSEIICNDTACMMYALASLIGIKVKLPGVMLRL